MIVCTLTKVHLLEESEWEIKGYIRIRSAMKDELEEVDALLRFDRLDNWRTTQDKINAFETEALTLTEDGYYANPIFRYRKRLTDGWEPGTITTHKKVYTGTVDILFPYTYFWVFCECPIFGDNGNCSVCLAVLCGGLRYEVAALRPKTREKYVKLFFDNDYDSIGQYTLSGYLHTHT